MMFLFISFTFLSLIVTPVTADRVISITFNNVTGSAQGLTCTFNDTLLLEPIFNINNYKRSRRQLRTKMDPVAVIHDARGLASSNSTVAVTHDIRGLQSTQQACNNACRHAVGRFCGSLSACIGFTPRRALQTAVDEFDPLYATCPLHVAEMNERLDQLIATSATLSTECKLLIGMTNRNATCSEGIQSGEISGFAVFGAGTIQNSLSCQGVMPGHCRSQTHYSEPVANQVVLDTYLSYKPVTFNVKVNLIPCFTTLELSIVGPKLNKKQTLTALSGGTLSVNVLPNARNAITGTYTITAVPNNNVQKAKSFKLIIK